MNIVLVIHRDDDRPGLAYRVRNILTTEAEIEQWMIAPTQDALKLQRPLPDGTLKIVARGEKEDPIG
jgi:putative SOS response-associated peptidase YedK